MTPDISEFSYGFALTHELIGLADEALRAAPIFPSLIEEGKAGGGYDVNLDIPGFPLFLQFKRADCMVRNTAKECGYGFAVPFYRMKITAKSLSAQHEMLLALDAGPNQVLYAAPLFHKVDELNVAYLAGAVSHRSFYIRPRDIGVLDNASHHVAFDKTKSWVFSDPRQTKGIWGDGLPGILRHRRSDDLRPLRAGIDEVLSRIDDIVRDRGLSADLPDRGRPGKTPEEEKLRRLADLSLRYFGAQLFIVQDSPSPDGSGGDDA